MTDKIFTAVDLQLGKLTINPRNLHMERRYTFLDAEGDVITQIKPGRLLVDVEWSNLPSSIQDALTAINTWTKNQALIQEEMI